MASIVIFGVRDTASLAHFYLKHDSPHDVAGFTVHEKYLPDETEFEGLPIVPFESVEKEFDPVKHRLFAPMTATRMNKDREAVFQEARRKGYGFISYVSSKATTFPGAVIGENCFILEDNTIQPYVTIGDDVVLWSGNHIGHHSTIKNHVFLTSHVVISGHCVIESYCFFGVNSTVRDDTHVAEGTLVAMGACLTGNTEAWGVYKGVPARKGDVPSMELG